MPYLQFRDQRVTLTPADQAVGAFDGAVLRIPGDDPAARAVVRIAADGTGVIARGAPDALVMVNGVQLGAEPSPLLHGDKVEIGGQQLHYGDDAKGGSTQFISAATLAEKVKTASSAPKKPTSASGGRLVSLVDGREYAVHDAGVTFGREIGNDIVIPSTEVSRRHAQIAPGEGGYILTDLSTNGVLVNGARVSERQVLGRGDVINIGGEEFRFYADKAKEPAASAPPPVPASTAAPAPAAATPAAPPPAAPVPPAAPPPPPMVVQGAMDSVGRKEIPSSTDITVRAGGPPPSSIPLAEPTVPRPAIPAAASAPPPAAPIAEDSTAPTSNARTPLATLEVINEGPMKGRSFKIFTPLSNVGRGAHNDVAIVDDSVSDSHAKILRKDGHWYVVDQGSTNGTYVAGRRVQGEQQLVGAPDVRFGNVKLTFRPSAEAQDTSGGTRAIAAMSVEQAKRLSTHAKAPVAAAAAARSTEKAPEKAPDKAIVIPDIQVPEKKKGCAAMIAFVIALGAAGSGMLALLLKLGS
jgi:pSer/pThr/pTyr-binding forkhead associated (FHA) protein